MSEERSTCLEVIRNKRQWEGYWRRISWQRIVPLKLLFATTGHHTEKLYSSVLFFQNKLNKVHTYSRLDKHIWGWPHQGSYFWGSRASILQPFTWKKKSKWQSLKYKKYLIYTIKIPFPKILPFSLSSTKECSICYHATISHFIKPQAMDQNRHLSWLKQNLNIKHWKHTLCLEHIKAMFYESVEMHKNHLLWL